MASLVPMLVDTVLEAGDDDDVDFLVPKQKQKDELLIPLFCIDTNRGVPWNFDLPIGASWGNHANHAGVCIE